MANLSSFYPQPVVAGTTEGTYAEGNASRIIDVTHSELLALMGAQNLKRGFHYRITDFVTEYISNDNEWISPANTANVSNNNGTAFTVASIAATPEPLIVYAYSSSEVSKEAYSELYPSDIIHYDPELTYLDGTRTAKGFIVYRKNPSRQLECNFDWRSVKFKRWLIDPTVGDNPIPQFEQNKEYKIGDLIYDPSSLFVQYCKKDHISGSSINGQNFLFFWRTNQLFLGVPVWSHNKGIERVGAGSVLGEWFDFDKPPSGIVGGVGQAFYYPVFSNNNGTLDATMRFKNISINSFIPNDSSTASQSFSTTLPNVVFINDFQNAQSFWNIKINNSNNVTTVGTLAKSNFEINNSSDIYIIRAIINSSINNCQYIYAASDLVDSNFDNCKRIYVSGGFSHNYKNSVSITSTIEELGVNKCFNIITSNEKNYYTDIRCRYNAKSFEFIEEKQNSLYSSNAVGNIFTASNNLPTCSYINETGEQIVEQIYDNSTLFHVVANEEILDKIDGIQNAATTLSIFSSIDNTTPSYTRNVSCWLNDNVEELTCISPWNSAYGSLFCCTAITPRHVLFARHITTQLINGTTIRFVTSDNQVVTRTIIRTITESGPDDGQEDSGIALLNENLPSSIHKAKILTPQIASYLPYYKQFSAWRPFTGLIYVDQDKKAIIGNWVRYFYATPTRGGAIIIQRPLGPSHPSYVSEYDQNKYEFYEPIVTNDSGGAVFSLLDGELVLMGALTFGATTPPQEGGDVGAFYIRGQAYNNLIAQIDAAEGISTGYTVTPVDLSGFAKVS